MNKKKHQLTSPLTHRKLQDSFIIEPLAETVLPSLSNDDKNKRTIKRKSVEFNASSPRINTIKRNQTPYSGKRKRQKTRLESTSLHELFREKLDSDESDESDVPLLVDVTQPVNGNCRKNVEGDLNANNKARISKKPKLMSSAGVFKLVESYPNAVHQDAVDVTSTENFFGESETDVGSDSDRSVTINDLIKTTEKSSATEILKQSVSFDLSERPIETSVKNVETENEFCDEPEDEVVSKSSEYDDSSKEETDDNSEKDKQIPESQEQINDTVPVTSKEPSKIKYIGKPDRVLILLDKNATLYLHGFIRLKVILGSVEIFGQLLDPTNEPVDLYSPRGSAYLSISTLESIKESGFQNLEQTLQSFTMDELELKKILDDIRPETTILLCNALNSHKIDFIEHYIPQLIFPKHIPGRLRCTFRENPQDWNVVKTTNTWESVADCILGGSKVFLCGGKGVGKSTYLRFLINKLLMKHREVCVIDLDPGQPEFTVPGCVSITTVRSPVFGPNYTHTTKPDSCVFVPYINASYDPSTYISAVQHLVKDFNPPPDIPMLINYMGFSRGLGQSIAVAVLAEVQPSLVVEILSNNPRKNFLEPLRLPFVRSELERLNELPVTQGVELSYNYLQMQAISGEGRGWELEPRQIREMCVLGYLGGMLPDGVNDITDCRSQIYKVCLSDIKLTSNGKDVHVAAINANLVALCSFEERRNGNDIYKCYGWGIVRGVDTIKNELYLMTPESADTLEKVEVLVYGSVNLPPSIYMTEEGLTGLIPYVSLGTLSSFSSIPRRSYLPKEVTMGLT